MLSTTVSCIIHRQMTPHILGPLLPEFHIHLPSCLLAISAWMLKASQIQLSPKLLTISTPTLNILTHPLSAHLCKWRLSSPQLPRNLGLIFYPSPYSPVCPVKKAVCSTFTLTEESQLFFTTFTIKLSRGLPGYPGYKLLLQFPVHHLPALFSSVALTPI